MKDEYFSPTLAQPGVEPGTERLAVHLLKWFLVTGPKYKQRVRLSFMQSFVAFPNVEGK
jgi:hypothetical protein